jgi:hypothetical protein
MKITILHVLMWDRGIAQARVVSGRAPTFDLLAGHAGRDKVALPQLARELSFDFRRGLRRSEF